MKYKTIYADPPWPEHGGGVIKRGADRHYSLMSVEDILKLTNMVKELSDENCHLYLWVTNNYLPAGLEVMGAWGFRYITKITWVKEGIGLGQYYRGQTEDCLFGVKGNLPYRLKANGQRAQGRTAIIAGPGAHRGAHSAKPAQMREMIEEVSWPPYIELFAREKYVNWEVWGMEAPEQDITSGKLL